MANKSGINIKESKKGTFTTAAKKRGMGVQEFASKVLANKDNYSSALVKKANFARNATKFNYQTGGKVVAAASHIMNSGNWYDNPIVSDPLMYSKQLVEMRKDPRYKISEAMPYNKAAEADTYVNPSTKAKLSDEIRSAMPYVDYAVQISDSKTGGNYIYPVFSKEVMSKEMGKQGAEMIDVKKEYAVGGLALAAIGGGLGIIGGLLGNSRAKKEAKAQQRAMVEGNRLASARDEKMGELELQQEYAPTFACGGKVKRKMAIGGEIAPENIALQQAGVVPAEVEGGESMVMPNGQDVNVAGPSHAQGGVDMNLPEGTRIYSDKLTVPGKGETFSEANKKISSKIFKYESNLDNPRATYLAKNTAKKMLERLNKEQDELFQLQQKINYNSTGTPSKQFSEGGTAIDWNQLGEGQTSATGLLGRAQNVNWGGVANTATTLAPALYNVGQGLFGKEQKFKASDYYNPNETSALNRMRRRTINADPMLEANRTAASTARYNVRNAARTRGELLGGYAPIAAGESRGASAAYMTKQQAENQYAGELAGMEANLGAQRAATKLGVADMNARTSAARRSMLVAGLGQLSQYAQLRTQARGLDRADGIRLKTLEVMYPDVWQKLSKLT